MIKIGNQIRKKTASTIANARIILLHNIQISCIAFKLLGTSRCFEDAENDELLMHLSQVYISYEDYSHG